PSQGSPPRRRSAARARTPIRRRCRAGASPRPSSCRGIFAHAASRRQPRAARRPSAPPGRFGRTIRNEASPMLPRPAFLALLVIRTVAPSRAAPPPTCPTGPREYVRVTARPYQRVRLTVTVVDRQGRSVKGLGAADFRITEDGVEYEAAEFGVEGE